MTLNFDLLTPKVVISYCHVDYVTCASLQQLRFKIILFGKKKLTDEQMNEQTNG